MLLNENYVEDDDNMFRFDYRWIDQLMIKVYKMFFKCSPEFIGWALQPPGWIKEWHCGVRLRNPCSVLLFTLHLKEKEVANISFQGAGS